MESVEALVIGAGVVGLACARALAMAGREVVIARNSGFDVRVADTELHAKLLVNSAGLRAPSVAKRIAGYPAERAPRELYAKGNYYTLSRRSPFSRLVYPVPEPGGPGRAV